jgi:putative redox protein
MDENDMKANLKWVDNLSFVGKSDSNNLVPMDGKSSVGGGDAAATPMELLLLGLGGCTAMDVVSILKKMRVQLDDFKVEIAADRAAEHPKIFTKIDIKFIFYGKEINEKNVERAIELSAERYCSASAMLKKTTQILTSFEIRETK